MTTFHEAYKSFDDFAKRQRKVKEGLDLQIRETEKQITKAQNELKTTISKTFPALETFPHEKLTQAAEQAGLPKNFTIMISAMQSDNASVEGDWDLLEKQYGKPSIVQKRLETSQAELAASKGAWKKLKDNIEREDHVLKPWDKFLRKEMGIEKPTLEEMSAMLNYCQDFGLGRTFDPAWHKGRRALKSVTFRMFALDDFVSAWERREAVRAEFAVIDAARSGLQSTIETDDTAMKAFARVDAKYFPLEKIMERLYDEILDALFDEKFASALAEKFGDEVAGPLFLPVAKIHNLQKVQAMLEAPLEVAKDTLGKLEQPLGALKQGAKRAPKREVDIDMGQVESAVVANEQMGEYYTGNAQKVRRSISSSTYSSRNYNNAGYVDINMMFMSAYMAAPIQNDPGCDPAFVHCVVTGMDASSISAQYNDAGASSFNALSHAFDASTGMPHISHGHSMPDLGSMPSLPDMSVPSIGGHSGGSHSPDGGSYGGSSYDGGSSSSYGSSSSSSYDGGSSYGSSSSSSYDGGSSFSSSSSSGDGGGGGGGGM